MENDTQSVEEAPKKKKPVPPQVSGPSPKFLEDLRNLGLSAGLRIAQRVKDLGKTFKQVQQESGVPSTTFFKLLKAGGGKPSDDLYRAYQLVKLAMTLGLPPDELLDAYLEDRMRQKPTRLEQGFSDEVTRQSVLDAGFPFGMYVMQVMDERGITPRMLTRFTDMSHITFFHMMRGDLELNRGLFNIDRIVRVSLVLGVSPIEMISLFYSAYDPEMEGLEVFLYMVQAFVDLPKEQRAMAVSMMTALRQSVVPGYPAEGHDARVDWEHEHAKLHPGARSDAEREEPLEDTPQEE